MFLLFLNLDCKLLRGDIMEKKEILNVLVKARRLLSNKEKWTQGYFARNAKGKECSPTSSAAVCFCALGAVRKVSKCRNYPVESYLHKNTKKIVGVDSSVVKINDFHGYDKTIKLFDESIKKLEKELKKNESV